LSTRLGALGSRVSTGRVERKAIKAVRKAQTMVFMLLALVKKMLTAAAAVRTLFTSAASFLV